MHNLAKGIDQVNRQLNRSFGLDAVYTVLTYTEPDLITGQQTPSEQSCRLKVRSMPISLRERLELSKAGINEQMTRWVARKADIADVHPGDRIKVSGLDYEVMSNPASDLDEFGIEWMIYTHRVT